MGFLGWLGKGYGGGGALSRVREDCGHLSPCRLARSMREGPWGSKYIQPLGPGLKFGGASMGLVQGPKDWKG